MYSWVSFDQCRPHVTINRIMALNLSIISESSQVLPYCKMCPPPHKVVSIGFFVSSKGKTVIIPWPILGN